MGQPIIGRNIYEAGWSRGTTGAMLWPDGLTCGPLLYAESLLDLGGVVLVGVAHGRSSMPYCS